ncbi:RING finger protein nhl-1-like [Ptychodera flava]|uniref:RING finger protein nhl-1-like n=1 Tax=Ptychodera flava TaxID=63121 RepID=UPI00396A7E1E
MAERIEELLNCAICLDRYTRPKILPCQHTFCQRPCLENLIDIRTRKIKCPECRREHKLPVNGTNGFPNNVTISRFLDIPAETLNSTIGGRSNQQGTTNERQCALCEGDVREGFRCSHCNRNFCQNCKNRHTDEVKLDIGRLVNHLRRGAPKLSDALTMVEQRNDRLSQHCETVKGEISSCIEKLVSELRNREHMLLSEVETFMLSEARNLNIQKENLEVQLAGMTSQCDATERHLSNAPSDIGLHELGTLYSQCVEYVEQLRNLEVNPTVAQDKKVKFTEANRHELHSSMMTYGDVSVTNQPSRSVSNSSSRSGSGSLRGRRSRSTPPPSQQPATNDFISLQINHAIPSAIFGEPPPLRSEARASPLRSSSSTPPFGHWPVPEPMNPSLLFRDIEDLGSGPIIPHASSTIGPEVSRSADAAASRGRGRGRRRQWDRPLMSFATDMEGISEASDSQSDFRNPAGNLTISERATNHRPSTRTMVRDSPTPNTQPQNPTLSSTPRQSSNAPPESSNFRNPAGNLTIGPRPRARRFEIRLDDANDEFVIIEDGNNATPNRRGRSNEPAPLVNYLLKGRSILRFGQKGGSDGNFSWPRGVAVLPDNQIVVCDSSNHRVQIFDEYGQSLSSFGSRGTGDGEFDCLTGVAVNSRSQIVIADRYNHRIQVIEPSGRFVSKFGQEGTGDGELNYPWGIACDSSDKIYVCDKDNHRIQVFGRDGSFLRMFGRHGHSAGQFDHPHYLAIHNNKVFISDSENHCIQVFGCDGQFQYKFGREGSNYGQFKYPRGIAIDPRGYVIVGDSGNNRVQVFRPSGTYMTCFGTFGTGNGQVKGIEGVTLMSNGNIVVSDKDNHRIQVF